MSKHYHFIGIGGIGMSGIAQLLLASGEKVTGSDIRESKITDKLKGLGAEIFIGHNQENIRGADLVVYSSAIKDDNPEIAAARRAGIPLVKRAQALAGLMRDKTVVAVTGSHGKTTTTSLASCLLLEAGFSPTAAIGGILKDIDNNACLGQGSFFVAEADESDGSFLYYQPKYSIITNIDKEHLDYYQTFKNAVSAYREFLGKTAKDGCVFACADDLNLRELLKDYPGRQVLFGLHKDADIYAQNIQIKGLTSEFDCFYRDSFTGHFQLSLGGKHNVSNALAVIALGLELKIGLEVIQKVLANYKGAKRRLEVKFQDANFLLLDDYAHHPTEIKATLAAARNLKFRSLIVVFQPHRYSRTKLLLEEFARCFDLADHLMVTDIYPAGEPALAGINKEVLCDKIRSYFPSQQVDCLKKEELIRHILETVQQGDLIITLGAGDITKINDELAQELKRKSQLQ